MSPTSQNRPSQVESIVKDFNDGRKSASIINREVQQASTASAKKAYSLLGENQKRKRLLPERQSANFLESSPFCFSPFDVSYSIHPFGWPSRITRSVLVSLHLFIRQNCPSNETTSRRNAVIPPSQLDSTDTNG